MPEQALYLDQLSPQEALDLLDLATQIDDLEASDLLKIWIEPSQSVFGASATLVLPFAEKTASAPWQRCSERFLQTYSALKSTEPRQLALREQGLPLLKGLAWLLLVSGESAADLAQPCEPREVLLISHNLPLERVAQLFEDLRFHATHTRIASAQEHYFFHVLDDEARRSSFRSLLAADGLQGLNPLTAYAHGAHKLFLPAEPPPGSRALASCCNLLQRFPGLLQVGHLASGGPLIAIDPQTVAAAIEDTAAKLFHMYYLGQLSFHSQILRTEQPRDEISIQIHDLSDSPEQLSRLQAALSKQAPTIGYRLELRATTQRDATEIERIRLLERQAEISYKLAYLDSVSRPRPRLLRFSEDQLPALAAVIHAFPLEVLQKGYPRYAFHTHQLPASDPQQARCVGYHYLYIEPLDAVLQELDPLLPYASGSNPPGRFWLDPFWARHYHRDENRSLLFVPEGQALFPAMHAWSASEMDSYLREVIGSWHEQLELPELPQLPIFLFTPSAKGAGELLIQILDRADFEPLHTRLGWINDHLVLGQTVDLSALIAELGSQATRAKLQDEIKARHQQSEKDLEEVLLSANRTTSRRLAELTETVNTEMNRVLERTHETLSYLKDMQAYLQELSTAGKEANEVGTAAHRILTKTEGKYRELGRFIQKLEADIERELMISDQARQRAAHKVKNSMVELNTTHSELRRKLYDLLRIQQ